MGVLIVHSIMKIETLSEQVECDFPIPHIAQKMSKEIPVDVEAYAAEYTGEWPAIPTARPLPLMRILVDLRKDRHYSSYPRQQIRIL